MVECILHTPSPKPTPSLPRGPLGSPKAVCAPGPLRRAPFWEGFAAVQGPGPPKSEPRPEKLNSARSAAGLAPKQRERVPRCSICLLKCFPFLPSPAEDPRAPAQPKPIKCLCFRVLRMSLLSCTSGTRTNKLKLYLRYVYTSRKLHCAEFRRLSRPSMVKTLAGHFRKFTGLVRFRVLRVPLSSCTSGTRTNKLKL